jgi:hypothetical protein
MATHGIIAEGLNDQMCNSGAFMNDTATRDEEHHEFRLVTPEMKCAGPASMSPGRLGESRNESLPWSARTQYMSPGPAEAGLKSHSGTA